MVRSNFAVIDWGRKDVSKPITIIQAQRAVRQEEQMQKKMRIKGIGEAES